MANYVPDVRRARGNSATESARHPKEKVEKLELQLAAVTGRLISKAVADSDTGIANGGFPNPDCGYVGRGVLYKLGLKGIA